MLWRCPNRLLNYRLSISKIHILWFFNSALYSFSCLKFRIAFFEVFIVTLLPVWPPLNAVLPNLSPVVFLKFIFVWQTLQASWTPPNLMNFLQVRMFCIYCQWYFVAKYLLETLHWQPASFLDWPHLFRWLTVDSGGIPLIPVPVITSFFSFLGHVCAI